MRDKTMWNFDYWGGDYTGRSGPQSKEEIIERIQECTTVLEEISSSKAWQILMKDMKKEQERLDNKWHELHDEEKMRIAKILKSSVLHVLELKDKYRKDLKNARDKLDEIQDTNSVEKDYDNEGVNNATTK